MGINPVGNPSFYARSGPFSICDVARAASGTASVVQGPGVWAR